MEKQPGSRMHLHEVKRGNEKPRLSLFFAGKNKSTGIVNTDTRRTILEWKATIIISLGHVLSKVEM